MHRGVFVKIYCTLSASEDDWLGSDIVGKNERCGGVYCLVIRDAIRTPANKRDLRLVIDLCMVRIYYLPRRAAHPFSRRALCLSTFINITGKCHTRMMLVRTQRGAEHKSLKYYILYTYRVSSVEQNIRYCVINCNKLAISSVRVLLEDLCTSLKLIKSIQIVNNIMLSNLISEYSASDHSLKRIMVQKT